MMEAIREEINSLGWISVLFGLGVVLLTLMCLLRFIHRVMKQIMLSWAQNRANRMEEQGVSNQGIFSEESSADGFSDLDELANLEEQMEIEQFLAEIRSSEVHSSTLSLSTHARKEFIANVLISQRVSVVQDECKDGSEENDKERELFVCRTLEKASDGKTDARPQCAICLLDYADGDAICWSHNARCSHHFHKGCMVEWLKSNNECPLCRNNYLALSDDEQTHMDDNSSLPDDPSVFSQVTYAVPSILHSEPTFEIELDPMQLAPDFFRLPDLDDGIPQDTVSAVTPSSDESIYTENDSWSQSDEGCEEGTGSSDGWSCPSVNHVEDLPNTNNYATDQRPRNRQCNQESTEQAVQREMNQDFSLELDDLIVDGLMQRLEKRTSSREAPLGIDLGSDSCTSVYTRGSDQDLG